MMSIKSYFRYLKLRILKSMPILSILSLFHFLPFILYNNCYFENATWRAIGHVPYTAAEASGRVFVGPLLSLLSFEFDILNTSGKQFLLYNGLINIFVSIFLLLVGSLIFYTRINKSKIDFYYLLVVFSFSLNPFLLEIFSIQTSCIYMIAPAALVIIAASLNTRNKFFDISIGALLVILSLGLYQSSFQILCGAITLIFLSDFQGRLSNALKQLLFNLSKLIIGALSYKFFILDQIEKGEYYKLNTNFFALDSSFLVNCFKRLMVLIDHNIMIFSESRLIVIFTIVALASYTLLYIHNSKRKLFASILLIFSTLMIVLCCFGVSILSFNSIEAPRVLGGFSILFIFVFHAFYVSIGKKFPITKLLMLVPVFYFIVISHSYGAMQNAQSDFSTRISLSIIDKLEELGLGLKKERVVFTGSIKASPVAQNSIQRNLILRKLFVPNLSGNWYSWLYIQHFGLEARTVYSSEFKLDCNQNALYGSPYYKITKLDNVFVVAFKNSQCFKTLK